MARYIRIEDDDDNGGAAAAALVLLAIVLIVALSPAIFLASLANAIFPMETRILWATVIIIEIFYVGYLYLKHRFNFKKIYIWSCVIVTLLGIIIMLLFPENIFLDALMILFPS